jgi:hypothetical protein
VMRLQPTITTLRLLGLGYSGTITSRFSGRGGRLFPRCSVSLLDGTRLVLLVVEYLLVVIRPRDRVRRGAEKDRRRRDCDCIRHVDDVLSQGLIEEDTIGHAMRRG